MDTEERSDAGTFGARCSNKFDVYVKVVVVNSVVDAEMPLSPNPAQRCCTIAPL